MEGGNKPLSNAMRFSLLLILIMVLGCAQKKQGKFMPWKSLIRDVGTFSSPRATDLDGDGVKDIIIGSGGVEFQTTDSAVLALSGADGRLLWTVGGRDQFFGAADFYDITGDEIADVFIGGRSAELIAVNGSNGELIWRFFPDATLDECIANRLYNFYNPQFIRDQDGDELDDILISNGGYVKALPNDPNRPPGKLMIIGSKSGKLIAEAYSPDGKEIYMSAVVVDRGSENPRVIFGTGGERIPGSLFVANVSEVLGGDLSIATELATSPVKGFIAPPAIVDITADGVPDIVVNAVDGRMIALDGVDYRKLWEVKIEGTEVYTSLGVGYFNSDFVPDLFANFGVGTFPNLMQSYQLAINGLDGTVIKLDSLGSFHYGSPVVYDIDNDSLDEVIYHINNYHSQLVTNQVMVFDINDDTIFALAPKCRGANIASTPLIDDLDGDGILEIIFAHENNPVDFFSIERKTGLEIHAASLDVSVSRPVRWGSYMGSDFNGIY